jgi:hypothetical protein
MYFRFIIFQSLDIAPSNETHKTIKLREYSFVGWWLVNVSNDAGRVKSVFSSFLGNSSTLLRRRTKYVFFCRFCSSVSP